MSEELKEDLIELGLQRYVSALFNAGYDNWDVISDSKYPQAGVFPILEEFSHRNFPLSYKAF